MHLSRSHPAELGFCQCWVLQVSMLFVRAFLCINCKESDFGRSLCGCAVVKGNPPMQKQIHLHPFVQTNCIRGRDSTMPWYSCSTRKPLAAVCPLLSYPTTRRAHVKPTRKGYNKASHQRQRQCQTTENRRVICHIIPSLSSLTSAVSFLTEKQI